MAVHGEHAVGEARHLVLEFPQKGGELDRGRVADGVRDVHNVRPGLDRRGDDLDEEAYVRAGGVHRGELDVGTEVLGEGDGLAGPPQDVLLVRTHLVLDVQVRGADEGVDAGPLRPLHRLPRALDVLLVDAGQPCDDWPFHLGGDAGDRLEVALARDREPGLDDVDLEPRELVGDLDLLLHGEGDAGRLLAVAKGGVEDLYSTHVSLVLLRSNGERCGS